MSVLATEEMSAVETVQMSAAEKGQMSAVETRQMSIGKTGRCPVSLFYISEVSIVDVPLFYNVQVADRRSGPKSAKMARNGSRMVARS